MGLASAQTDLRLCSLLLVPSDSKAYSLGVVQSERVEVSMHSRTLERTGPDRVGEHLLRPHGHAEADRGDAGQAQKAA